MSVLGHYEPLSFLDASFLALETPNHHMHVGAIAVFEAGPLTRPDGGIDFDRIRTHIAGKLRYVPRYRQRLAWVPFERTPVWIDDDQFDIDVHVRHTALPRPGTEDQLKALAGRILSQPLDRARPLWELWVVEGLEGDRFAIISKVHHAMIDGMSGAALMAVILDLQPTDEVLEPEPWEPRPAPPAAVMLIGETFRRFQRGMRSLRSLRAMAETGRDAATSIVRRLQATIRSLTSGWLVPTDLTPLNPQIGPKRRVDWWDLELDRVKAVRRATGATVNDVVLATVAGAVRTFLIEERDFDVAELDFRVMAPVSVRPRDQALELGNQVAMWLVRLPLEIDDPVARLEAIREQTRTLKETDQALGAKTLVELSSGVPMTVLTLAARLAATAYRPFNMTVTNVPGPQFPLYLLGSRMLRVYPIVPLWARHGLGVALFSYVGILNWGINADWDAVPDIDRFVDHLQRSFEALEQATTAPEPTPKRRARSATAKTSKAKTAGAKTGTTKTVGAKTSTAKTTTAKTSTAKTATKRSAAAGTAGAKTSKAKTAGAKTGTTKTAAAAKTSKAKTATKTSAAAETAGAKTSGARSSSTKKAGPKQTGAKQAGAKKAGPEKTSPKQSSTKKAGPEKAGPEEDGGATTATGRTGSGSSSREAEDPTPS